MRKPTRYKRTLVLFCLTEGSGVNATARICGVPKLTVLRLLADTGSFAIDYHDAMVRSRSTP